MAQQIGIRLNLTGAQQVTGGLDTVTRSLGTLDARTLKVGDALKGLGAGLVAALSVGTITQWVRSAIDATDQAGKLAQQLGIATDKVAGLQIAFRQSGASAEQLVPTMAKLSAAITNGNRALDAMGVATRNTDGTLRDTRQVLGDVADRFASYRDGAAKTALAVQLFGEEGAKLLPLLSGGSRALQDADEKARAFGLTLSNEAAAAAARFNDSLDDLRAQAQGFGTSVAADVLPVLATFTAELNKVLLEARNAKTGVDGLAKDNALREWAEGAAIAVATVAEGLVGVSRLAIGIGGAFRAVAADLTFLGEVARNTLGAPLSGGILNPENRENIRRALEERNRIVGEFNAQLDRLWNYDGSALSRRLREQFAAARAGGGAPVAAAAGGTVDAPTVGANGAVGVSPPSIFSRESNRLQLEKALLSEKVILGRELNQGEKELITLRQQFISKTINADEFKLLKERIQANQKLRDGIANQIADEKTRADNVANNAALEAKIKESLQREDERRSAETQSELELQARRDLARMASYDAAEQAAEDAYQRQTDLQKQALQAELELQARRDLARIAAYEADEEAINAALKNADDLVKAIQSETAALGMTNEEREIAIALRDLENKGLKKGEHAYEEYAKKIRQAIVDRNAARESIAQAEQLGREWERITDQVGQSLADALMNGGKSAGEGIKRYFSTLILQPIIRAIVDPVARTVTGVITSIAPSLFGSAAAAGTAGAAGAAGGLFSSPLSLLSSAYSAVTGSTASFLGGAAQSLGKMIGGGIGGSIGAFGAGMQGAVLAPGLAGPTTVGAGGAMGLGATLGAALPLIGLALGALWEPLFGRRLKDQGIEGSFGAGGFSGQQYQFFKGGLFRSNKTTRSALDPELQTLLSDTFLSARTSIATMARELGMATDALAGFSKDVKLSFMNLTQEQIQEKLAEELGLVTDEMARLVAGAGATAESLQQLYQAVMSERSQLEQRLLQLQGDTAEIRRRERDGLHETNRALYDRITALEDEQAAVAKLNAEIAQRISTLQGELQQAESERLGIAQRVISERTALEQRLLQAQGNTAALRERELEALDPLNRAFARFVLAAEDAAAAAGTAAQNVAALAGAGQGIAQFVAQLRAGGATATPSPAAARSAYAATLSLARAGNAEASERITGEAQTLIAAVTARARNAAEVRAITAQVATELEALPAVKTWQDQQTQLLQQISENTGENNTVTQALADATAAGFARLDVTADGLLTAAELEYGLAGLATDAQISALIKAVDANGDGMIDATELAAADIRRNATSTAAAIAALQTVTSTGFGKLDTTADGLLTFAELQTGLSGKASDAQILALLRAVDTNADGQISELELLGALTDDVSRNTADTVTETEKTVAEMRSLVTETIVNSGKLTTLNTSIGSLTNALTAATEQQRVQREIELLQTQGTGAASALGRLSSQYETSRAEAMQRYVDIYSAGWPSEVLNYGLEQELKGLTPGTPEYLEGLVNRLNQLNQATSFAFGTRLELPTSSQVQAGQLGYRASVTAGTAPQSYITTVQNALAGRTPLQTAAQELEALRQQIRALGGIPAFALGGMHSGGLRLVGERGPELEVTGPARYWSAADTTAMLGNSARREEVLAAEIRALRAEVAGLRAETRATAENTGKTRRLWERVTRDGESMQVTDVTPAP